MSYGLFKCLLLTYRFSFLVLYTSVYCTALSSYLLLTCSFHISTYGTSATYPSLITEVAAINRALNRGGWTFSTDRGQRTLVLPVPGGHRTLVLRVRGTRGTSVECPGDVPGGGGGDL